MAKSKNIAIFGGTFDPPHAGHYEIARRLARRKGVDQVWIVPVYRHAFGKKSAPFGKRLSACRAFFKGIGPKVKVKDWERRLGGVSYTVRLLRFLHKRHPDAVFHLAVGSDAYRERRAWKDFKEIERLARLIVFPRGPGSAIPNVSSTEIRRLKARRSAE
ncbi:MAG TPA: nicotinate-nicotinamide nucleotide adenylyltransferase [bacterium]|nr:nicotinate-nicotinamide nucleotide adenylyltransferase [bacterium]